MSGIDAVIVLGYALLNRARGSRFFGLIKSTVLTRIASCSLMAAIYFLPSGAALPTAYVFAGLMLWASFGWGKYFSAFHGRFDPNEQEIGWIDAMGLKAFPNNGDVTRNRLRGAFCMGLRGLFLYPMFALLGAPLLGLCMFGQGLCYAAGRLVEEKYAVALGEFLTGLLIGVLILAI